MKTLLLSAMLLAASTPAFAQEDGQPKPQRPPACEEKIHHDFDFWIGDWDVYDLKGEKAGENSITREEYGCLLVEHWTDNSGVTGQSYNFYDNASQKWRQVWVSAGATIDYAGGLNDKGEMVLEGTIGYRNGKTAPFRGVWTKLSNGDVRQHFEQYDAEEKSWKEWFTGIYKRKTAP